MRLPLVVVVSLLVAAPLLPAAQAADRVIEIEAGTNPDGSMYLKPNDVTVNIGDQVTFRVKNVDSIFHDVALLSYDGQDIENEVPAHTTSDKTFTATKAGDFRLVCEVTGHKQKGMQGTLHVVDPNAKKAPGFEGITATGALVIVAALVARRSR